MDMNIISMKIVRRIILMAVMIMGMITRRRKKMVTLMNILSTDMMMKDAKRTILMTNMITDMIIKRRKMVSLMNIHMYMEKIVVNADPK